MSLSPDERQAYTVSADLEIVTTSMWLVRRDAGYWSDRVLHRAVLRLRTYALIALSGGNHRGQLFVESANAKEFASN
jgi:hypothetical protein